LEKVLHGGCGDGYSDLRVLLEKRKYLASALVDAHDYIIFIIYKKSPKAKNKEKTLILV
jgi:hypothetical protein